MKLIFKAQIIFIFFIFCLCGNEISENKSEISESKITTPYKKHSLSLQVDNDIFLPRHYNTDRYYTFGIKLSFKSAERHTSENKLFTKPLLLNLFDDQSASASIFAITSEIYTPYNIKEQYAANDTKYAGLTYLSYTKYFRNSHNLEVLRIDAGIAGKKSGASSVMTNFHKYTHNHMPRGWDTQISDRFIGAISYTYAHKFVALSDVLEILPFADFELGNIHNYAAIGASVKLGYGVSGDFMPSGIKTTHIPYVKLKDNFRIYLHASAIARLNQYMLLGVGSRRDARDLSCGILGAWKSLSFGYAFVVRSIEMQNQIEGVRYGGFILNYSW